MRAGDIGASYTTTRGRAASSQRVAAEAGVTSYGLTIELPGEEPAHPWAKVRVPFHYFFLRKLAFVKYGCAFICFPGGFGTLDELFEALNLKGAHRLSPFPVILAGPRYWTGLVDWLSNVSVPTGCLSPEHIPSRSSTTPLPSLGALSSATQLSVGRWSRRNPKDFFMLNSRSLHGRNAPFGCFAKGS